MTLKSRLTFTLTAGLLLSLFLAACITVRVVGIRSEAEKVQK